METNHCSAELRKEKMLRVHSPSQQTPGDGRYQEFVILRVSSSSDKHTCRMGAFSFLKKERVAAGPFLCNSFWRVITHHRCRHPCSSCVTAAHLSAVQSPPDGHQQLPAMTTTHNKASSYTSTFIPQE